MKPVLYEPSAKDFENDGGIATLADCKSLLVTEEANGSYIIEATFPITTKYAMYLEDVNYQIKCKPNDLDDYHVFYIYNHYKDMSTGLLYVNAKSRTAKLGNRSVKKVIIQNKTGIEAMSLLHDGMDLESDIQMFSNITSLGSTTFEVSNPLECIKGIEGSLNQVYGGEIKHEPFKISLLKRRGKDDVTTIRFRKNLEGFKLELNWDGLITRIFPYADIQNSEGETERIYGDAVDSEYVGNYDGEVYSRYIQFTEEQGVTDEASLNNVAGKYFKSMNKGVDKPKVSAEVEIKKLDSNSKFADFLKLGLFDTFTVFHERYNIDLEMTVNKIVYDALSEKTESITAGDPKFTFFEEQESQFTEVMKKIPSKTYNSAFIDYVTEIISGNDGGHVIWWPKNRPTDLFFCDEPVLENARQVLRINKSGIGFSSNGWKGPFDTAWTLDGVFVADFITAGVLRAIDIVGVNITGSNITGTNIKGSTFSTINPDGIEMRVLGGIIHFINPETDERLGYVTMNGSPDNPNIHIANLKTGGKMCQIVMNKERIQISHTDEIELQSPLVKVSKRLDVKELYVNGVKIDTNGSGTGGPSGGDLTIFVKVLALTAKYEMGDRSSGYYHEPLDDGAGWNYGKYSFTQVYEMTPFLDWLATNYPSIRNALVGSVGTAEFNNSWAAYGAANETLFTGVQAEYFCRQKLKPMIEYLKSNTGVDLNDGNKWLGTLSIFSSILNWYPAAVQGGFLYRYVQQYASSWNDAGFIADVCDFAVANAADIVAPEYVAGIQNRFRAEKVDALALTTPTKIPFDTQAIGGYRIPIAKPITVSSEFGMRVHPITGVLQLHNGIDLVNGNPNTPILAANSGKVVQASGEYYDWYGNYVVIQHSDGLYTGYAHLSRIDVTAGQTVTAGQQLGLMGTTGPSTGEHLHFQFMKNFWPSGDDDFMNPREKISF